MRFFLLILILFITFSNCSNKHSLEVDISNIEVDFSIIRFEQLFYNANLNDILKLKTKYPIFFPKNINDSVWFNKINNKSEQELFKETQKIYEDFSGIEEELRLLFKHVKYYYPDFTSPKVITVNSNIDYENRVIYVDSLLLISLDAYLGEHHPFYSDYPAYIKRNNQKNAILVDVAEAIIKSKAYPTTTRTFLSKMITQGKNKYLQKAFLPKTNLNVIFGYEKEKMNWAKTNEEEIWKYFIENKLLFSSDSKLDKRFLATAPFSKFYMQGDTDSPGQIGVWIGYQIVNFYMQNNHVSLQELLKKPSLEVFKNSKYKPKNNGS